MTLNQIKYFCATCRCRSITQAAKELYVTQPAVSLAIKELETEFGVTLFFRSGSRLTLTGDGERLYEKAIYLLQYCNEMQEEISDIGRHRVPLRIGIPPMLSTLFFPELYDAYLEQYPNAHIILEEYGSMRACRMVQNDELDIALVNMEVYNLDKMNSHVLLNDQLVYCISPDHKLAGRERIPIAELEDQELILFNADSVQNELLKTAFETNGIHPLILMRSSQLYTTLRFIQNGKCGCFLFSNMLKLFPEIRGIPLDPPIKVNIGMVWKKGRYVMTEMQHFIRFTEKYLEHTADT